MFAGGVRRVTVQLAEVGDQAVERALDSWGVSDVVLELHSMAVEDLVAWECSEALD